MDFLVKRIDRAAMAGRTGKRSEGGGGGVPAEGRNWNGDGCKRQAGTSATRACEGSSRQSRPEPCSQYSLKKGEGGRRVGLRCGPDGPVTFWTALTAQSARLWWRGGYVPGRRHDGAPTCRRPAVVLLSRVYNESPCALARLASNRAWVKSAAELLVGRVAGAEALESLASPSAVLSSARGEIQRGRTGPPVVGRSVDPPRPGMLGAGAGRPRRPVVCYSTVTDFARLRGLSTSQPRSTAM